MLNGKSVLQGDGFIVLLPCAVTVLLAKKSAFQPMGFLWRVPLNQPLGQHAFHVVLPVLLGLGAKVVYGPFDQWIGHIAKCILSMLVVFQLTS